MMRGGALMAMLLVDTGTGAYVPPRAIDVARRHGGNWSQRSGISLTEAEQQEDARLGVSNPHTQGGPLLGNADLSAVLQVDTSGSTFSWYVTKTDAWSTTDIFGLGMVTLQLPALNGSSQSFIWQDLGSATTFIAAGANVSDDSMSGGVVVRMSSFVAATTNILVTTVNISSPRPTQLLVSNAVYAGLTYELDPKTRMPTGAPPRTLKNCTSFDNNGVRNRGGNRAGFADSDANTMWGLFIQCTNGTSEASRLGLATRVLTADTTKPSSGSVEVSEPECGPVAEHAGTLSACTTTVSVAAGTTSLTVLSSSLSNINVAGDGTPGPPTTLENVEALRKATIDLIDAATAAGTVTTLQAEHEDSWAAYWNSSAVSFPSHPDFEAYYYRSMYLLGSSTHETSAVPPGLCGAWFAGQGPSRYGDFTLNYNFESIFYGVYEANRPDLAAPYYKVILDYANMQGKEDAQHYISNCSLNGSTHMPGHIGPWGHSTSGDMNQHSDASFAALGFIRHWEVTRNETFLRQISYPFLKDVATWWLCWLTKNETLQDNDGRTRLTPTYTYNDYGDCTRESCCQAFPCTQGPQCPSCRVPNVNPAISIAFIYRIFNHLISAAKTLQTDAESVSAWQDVLDHMPSFSAGSIKASPFPVGVACPQPNSSLKSAGDIECTTGTTVLLPQAQPFYFAPADNPLQLYAVWPGEQISLGADPAMLTVARNSIDLTAALVNDNSPPEVFTAAVRVGYDVEQFYGNLSAMLTRLRPNGELGIGFPMEHLGVTAAVSEMLLQSHELETGLLRFFPGVRKNETVSFAKLRTNGGFLVSALYDKGAASNIVVESTVGGVCSFASPFDGGAKVTTVAGRTVATSKLQTSGQFSFETEAGTSYAITAAAGAGAASAPGASLGAPASAASASSIAAK